MPRRLAITAPHKVGVLEYEDPPLQVGQVLVKTELASGKHGTTTAGFEGLNFRGQNFDQKMRIFVPQEEQGPPKPKAPGGTGNNGVGVVVAVGPEVTRWKVGDRVMGFMDVRETNICNQDRLWELGTIDPLVAVCLDPAHVAIHCVRESNVRFGETVAVIGLGAIGLMAVRMAVLSGAEQVFAVDMIAKRRECATRNGAHHVVDPKAGDPAVEIHRLLGGPGVDVAIEVSGAYAALHTAIRAARVAGTVCSAGFYQGESRGLWLGREWHHNRLTLVVPHGCGWGHPPRDYPRWDTNRAFDCIVSMMRQGRLTVSGMIDPIVPIEEGPEVWRMIEQEPDRVIKYAVKF
ncbi:MAG: zinc-binding alcohol dehydrogenase [Anaerolineae bacterium]|nr:zinc-binding alcohol dehydrogenase [Anaerolineae bacterium]